MFDTNSTVSQQKGAFKTGIYSLASSMDNQTFSLEVITAEAHLETSSLQPTLPCLAELERKQRQLLGPFFKVLLPSGEDGLPQLCRFGRVLEGDTDPTTKDGLSLRDIVQLLQDNSFVALIGKSGCGKTTALQVLAAEHFVLYIDCVKDFTMKSCLSTAQYIYSETFSSQSPLQSWDEAKSVHSQAKNLCRTLILYNIAARMIYLKLLMQASNITPLEWFHVQSQSGGQHIILTIYQTLRKLHLECFYVIASVTKEIGGKMKLPIVLDDAQNLEKHLMSQVLSATASTQTDDHSCWDVYAKRVYGRHLRNSLGLVLMVLQEINKPIIVSGTSLTLRNIERPCSAVRKQNYPIYHITMFPICRDPLKLIGSLINLDGCTIEEPQLQLLSGRFRIATSVVWGVVSCCNKEPPNIENKQKLLTTAVTSSIDTALEQLKSHVECCLESLGSREVLERLVLAWEVHHGRLDIQSSKDELIEAICSVSPCQEDGPTHLMIDEAIVVKAIRSKLCMTPSLNTVHLDYLVNLLDATLYALGCKTTSKGSPLDFLVCYALAGFDRCRVCDLPFLQGLQIPPLWDQVRIAARQVGTASNLGLEDGIDGDIRFFTQARTGQILIPQTGGTRPDGFLLLENKVCAVTTANKFYTISVPSKDHQENITSSDARRCFHTSDGSSVNKNLQKYWDQFQLTPVAHLQGLLRIHVVLPRVAGGTPKPYVHGNDIFAFVDLENLDRFFMEDRHLYSDKMKHIKEIIRWVYEKGSS
eukprot:TRINITY_DN314_c0_g2_i2.p1 TRINITY_DN314_c0_g2~~TRINITY_DN314_c0_g2_i2.p1  ORF type:complete len:757 (-),score=101.00 TRINITY_DN314_c0_g2_i2:137-2407(-)